MKFYAIALGLGLTLSAWGAQAQVLTFSDSLSKDLETGVVATLSFDQVGLDTVFTLKADWDSELLGDNVFVGDLYFNYTGDTKLKYSNVSGGSKIEKISYWNKPHSNAGYKFNYALDFTTSNKIKGGRLTDGESLSWTFKNTDADDFGGLALVHLQALDLDGCKDDSVKVITAPIPEPETYAMVGLGLLAVSAARRRKRM